MEAHLVDRLRSNPDFLELERRRGALGWTLTAVMLVIYFGFILLIAFVPQVLAMKVGTGVMTLGFPLGIGVILSAIVLTGVYVWRANALFDPMTRRIKESVQ